MVRMISCFGTFVRVATGESKHDTGVNPLRDATDSPECAVCQRSLAGDEPVFWSPCGHVFHLECAKQWSLRRMSCPECRASWADSGIRESAPATRPELQFVEAPQPPRPFRYPATEAYEGMVVVHGFRENNYSQRRGFRGDVGAAGIRAVVEGDARAMETELTMIDPDTDNFILMKYAAQRADAAVMAVILADPRVDPAYEECVALAVAAEAGNTATLTLLLADPRVEPAADNSRAALGAAFRGQLLTLALLIADGRSELNEATLAAVICGSAAAMEMIIADPRVDLAFRRSYVLKIAAYMGRVSIVRLLLGSDRITDLDGAMYCGVDGNSPLCATIIASDPRVSDAARNRMRPRLRLGEFITEEQFRREETLRPKPGIDEYARDEVMSYWRLID